MRSEQPRLQNFPGRVLVGFAGEFGVHPGVTFGAGPAFEDDQPELAAGGQELQTGAVGGFVLFVKELKDSSGGVVGGGVEDFVGFHRSRGWTAGGSVWGKRRAESSPSRAGEIDSRRQSGLYPAP